MKPAVKITRGHVVSISLTCLVISPFAAIAAPAFQIEHSVVLTSPPTLYWAQSRAALIPEKPARVILTTQQIEKAGSHAFQIEHSVVLTSPPTLYWAQSRAALIPEKPARVILTTQQIEKAGSHGYRDVFFTETVDG